jgi:prepilin-type N-terminal cleavage/methylation domain-containing protein
MSNSRTKIQPRRSRTAGFTMIELLVAAAIFTIISASAFSLMAQHQPIFNQQQNLAEVNIALRNAVAQMQLDLANAGANYYSTVNIPNYPVGVVITNHVEPAGSDCRSGTPLVYSTNCFDQMAIVTADKNTPPAGPQTSTGACINTSSNGTIYLSPSTSTTGYGTVQSVATAAAANYLSGDQILFVSNSGNTYTTAKLSAAGSTAKLGSYWYVTLTYGLTATNGTNTAGSTGNDQYNMTTNLNSMLATTYCNNSTSYDYVLRLLPITYKVDLTTPTNPALLRIVAGQSGATVATETLATQIIGFKLGASLFNNITDLDATTYFFDASTYNNGSSIPYNYTMLRSVMVSLIGRTNPNPDPTYVFRNTFDNGPYQIQGVSLVVNPRNMSMND